MCAVYMLMGRPLVVRYCPEARGRLRSSIRDNGYSVGKGDKTTNRPFGFKLAGSTFNNPTVV